MQTQQLPVGYWIKQADNLLTSEIDRIQSQFGLSRTGWQLLNSIAEKGSITKDSAVHLLTPFTDAANTAALLSGFETAGDITITANGLIQLTEKGKALYSNCLQQQKIFREKAMQHISGRDYETTVATLQQIVKNIRDN